MIPAAMDWWSSIAAGVDTPTSNTSESESSHTTLVSMACRERLKNYAGTFPSKVAIDLLTNYFKIGTT